MLLVVVIVVVVDMVVEGLDVVMDCVVETPGWDTKKKRVRDKNVCFSL